MPLRVWLHLVDYCLHVEASVRQSPDVDCCVNELEFAHLVSPSAPILDWLEIARDWQGYAVNGWPEGWEALDD